MKLSAFYPLFCVLVFTACKKSDSTAVVKQLDCPTEVKPVVGWLQGGFLLPNAFSPNGDGKNDLLQLIMTDSLAVRNSSISFSDSAGNTLYTLTQPGASWNGVNPVTHTYYPPGIYRADYTIVLNGKGVMPDSTISGHNCIWLIGNQATQPGYVQLPADSSVLKYLVFPDMVDPHTLQHPYSTGETFWP